MTLDELKDRAEDRWLKDSQPLHPIPEGLRELAPRAFANLVSSLLDGELGCIGLGRRHAVYMIGGYRLLVVRTGVAPNLLTEFHLRRYHDGAVDDTAEGITNIILAMQ